MHDDGRGYPVQLLHEDLEAVRLAKEGLWGSYERSKQESELAAKSLKNASADLGTWLTRRLKSIPFRHANGWEKRVQADQAIRNDLRSKVARFLTAHPIEDPRLAGEQDLEFFIARRLVEEYAESVLAERTRDLASLPRFFIRSGRELIDQAPRKFPALEICEKAERQILGLTGNEKFFGWLIDAISTANREMQNWVRGPFPHELLPDSAQTESMTVRKNSKLRDLRRFETRRGEWLLFFPHMKNKAENIRVHYKVDEDRRILMIGYVGPHLSLDPT